MKIAFPEIWNFIALVRNDKTLRYSLNAGHVRIKGITVKTILNFKQDPTYDPELLPSLFTFREILWQPNVLAHSANYLTSLRILNAFCEDTIFELETGGNGTQLIYAQMISGIQECTQKAIKDLALEYPVEEVLMELRISVFPIIKFFIAHPMNRKDHYSEAMNRLNYAVKIILTDFYTRYSALIEPYWTIQKKKIKKSD